MTQQPGTPRNPVKDVRMALDLSQEQMARELGCSQSTVGRCEQARAMPHKPAVLAKLLFMAKQAGIEIEI
jgi:DNA-binding transcriptional regulator YiaG